MDEISSILGSDLTPSVPDLVEVASLAGVEDRPLEDKPPGSASLAADKPLTPSTVVDWIQSSQKENASSTGNMSEDEIEKLLNAGASQPEPEKPAASHDEMPPPVSLDEDEPPISFKRPTPTYSEPDSGNISEDDIERLLNAAAFQTEPEKPAASHDEMPPAVSLHEDEPPVSFKKLEPEVEADINELVEQPAVEEKEAETAHRKPIRVRPRKFTKKKNIPFAVQALGIPLLLSVFALGVYYMDEWVSEAHVKAISGTLDEAWSFAAKYMDSEQRMKNRQAEKNLEVSRQFLDKKDWVSALRFAEAALKVKPQDVEALKTWTEAAEKLNFAFADIMDVAHHHAAQQEWEPAKKAVTKALLLKPNDAAALEFLKKADANAAQSSP